MKVTVYHKDFEGNGYTRVAEVFARNPPGEPRPHTKRAQRHSGTRPNGLSLGFSPCLLFKTSRSGGYSGINRSYQLTFLRERLISQREDLFPTCFHSLSLEAYK